MFTVIIAEKEHIDRIREYDIFLSPFADHRHIALCRWYPEKDTLAEAVPELRETVAREKTWRALILTTGEGLPYRNPFDLVPFEPPQKEWEEPLEEYLPRLRQVKLAAFDAAAEKPLTKLVTHLCRQPLVQAGRNGWGRVTRSLPSISWRPSINSSSAAASPPTRDWTSPCHRR